MNLLDLAIVGAMTAAALGGWRLGGTTRVFAWLGVAIGLLVAVPLVAPVVGRFGGGDADTRVTVALVFLLLCGAAGQGLGILVGATLHRRRPDPALSARERLVGAVLGSTGVLVVLWMMLPSLAVAAGWPARATRDSAIVGVVELAPAPPGVFDAWGEAVLDAPYPEVLDREVTPPDPGRPPTESLDRATIASVRPAVVHVTGVACDRVLDGSGFVVEDRLVLTNAHVVAGESATTVIDASGLEHDAVAVLFDPRHDLALLAVPTLDATPRPLGDPEEGATVGIFGHPAGGALEVTPGRIGETIRANGTDIYREEASTRTVVVLAAEVVPGDSGAPVVDDTGAVVAVVFATDPGSTDTAYALHRREIDAALAADRAVDGADTGSCVR